MGTPRSRWRLALPFAVGKSPVAIASADLNGDSHPDIVVVNQTDNTISVLLGNGDGTFISAANSPLATGQAPTAVTIADFNGDSLPDIAVTDPQTDSVSVYLGLGQGLFAPGVRTSRRHESHGHPGGQLSAAPPCPMWRLRTIRPASQARSR